MPFHVSFFFAQQSSKLGGWSENFWNNGTDLSTLSTNVLDLRKLLDDCTGAQAYCPRVRISDVGVFRNVVTIEIAGSQPNPIDSNNPDADYPSTALQLQLTAAPNYKTTQWLRGLPDSVTTLSGTYNPPGYFVTAINKLIAYLSNGANQYALNVLDKTVVPKVITNITQQGVVTCPGHGYATGNKVRVKGVKGLVVANGVWAITVIDTNTFSLNFWVPPPVVLQPYGTPTARLQSYIQVACTGGKVVRVTSHRTGRPTGLLGGRRHRRRI